MTASRALRSALSDPPLRGYIDGLALVFNSTTSIDISAGVAMDSTVASLMQLTATVTKTTSSWAVGSGNGGLDTGAIAAGTWYHFYLIQRPDTGVVDVLFSLSASAPTMPANYTLKRRIMAMRTNGSSQWTAFHQYPDGWVLWDTPVNDIAATAPGTTAVTRALSVPTGIKVLVHINIQVQQASVSSICYLSSLDQVDVTPAAAAFSAFNVQGTNENTGTGTHLIWTNTSAQIRSRMSGSDASVFLGIVTNGWKDPRGQNA